MSNVFEWKCYGGKWQTSLCFKIIDFHLAWTSAQKAEKSTLKFCQAKRLYKNSLAASHSQLELNLLDIWVNNLSEKRLQNNACYLGNWSTATDECVDWKVISWKPFQILFGKVQN